MPTMITVPKRALPKPPPSSIAAGGSDVNTAQCMLLAPLTTSIETTENKGANANSVSAVV